MYCANRDCPDRQATGVPGEYRQGIERCPYCGEPLVAGPPPDRIATDGSNGEEPAFREVEVLTTQELPLADIAAAILEQAGIPHLRRSRGGALVAAGSAHLAPIPGEEHRIAVAEEDADEARALLAGLGEEGSAALSVDEEEEHEPLEATQVGVEDGGGPRLLPLAVVLAALLALVVTYLMRTG